MCRAGINTGLVLVWSQDKELVEVRERLKEIREKGWEAWPRDQRTNKKALPQHSLPSKKP